MNLPTVQVVYQTDATTHAQKRKIQKMTGAEGEKKVKKDNEHGIGTEEPRVYVPPLGLQIVYLFLIPGEVPADGAGPTGRDGLL